jgi:effector-binding domain-containing protein
MPDLSEHRLVQLDPRPTVAVRIQSPMADLDVAALFDSHLPAIYEKVTAAGQSGGAPYGRYHMFGPKLADIEIGVPIEAPVPGLDRLSEVKAGDVGLSELPGGLTAVVVHRGPYDSLGESYGIFHDWIHEQGHDEGDGPWESYVDDPGSVADPTQVRTEIYWPAL